MSIRTLIMGAAGRDYNFNVFFRGNRDYEVLPSRRLRSPISRGAATRRNWPESCTRTGSRSILRATWRS